MYPRLVLDWCSTGVDNPDLGVDGGADWCRLVQTVHVCAVGMRKERATSPLAGLALTGTSFASTTLSGDACRQRKLWKEP